MSVTSLLKSGFEVVHFGRSTVPISKCRGADVREIVTDLQARELIRFRNPGRATREIRIAVFPPHPLLCVFDLSVRVRVHFGKKRASACQCGAKSALALPRVR